MEQTIVEQLKARRKELARGLKIAAICLSVGFDEDLLARVKSMSLEAEACNKALRAILGDYWEELEEIENEGEGA